MSFLEKNLAAMRHTPDTASLVAAAAIPHDFALTTGTDGTQTFLRTAADHLQWLGETSMPASSAAPLVAGLDPGTVNGLGLSIGTGYEWLAFLNRLSRPQALFVYESDAALLKMALTVCDMTSPLADARIVILGGPMQAAANELANFLATHLGHEPPTVLHPLPTLTGERRNALLAGGEAIVRHAVQSRQGMVNELAGQMAKFSGDSTATLALLATPRYFSERPLHDALSPDVPRLYLDKHWSASIAWRAKTLLTHRPAKVVSDFFRPDLGCIPASIPVETWIPPLVGPGFWQPPPGNRVPPPSSLMEHDRIVVQAHVHQLLLESLGISRKQIELRPLQRPMKTTQTSGPATAPRVAMIADLPRTDAAFLGVQLPTHQSVHAAASALITDDYLTVNLNNAADILRRALSRAGVSQAAADSDAGLKDSMLRVIRDVLIPALPPLTLARHLIDQQIPVHLIGDWPDVDRPASPLCTITPFPASASDWANRRVKRPRPS